MMQCLTRCRPLHPAGRFLLYALSAVALIAAQPAMAEPTTKLTRVSALAIGVVPQSVPGNYVVTPNGYFHPSCVHEVEQGAHLLADGGVQHANGVVTQQGLCAYPHFSRHGERIEAAEGLAPSHKVASQLGTQSISWDWVEYSGTQSSATPAIGYLSATWQVPSNPSSHGSQTLYYFPGAQLNTIIQPVLGWNAEGDNAWTLSSWNCCTNGQTNYSKFISTKAGDTISGVMSGTSCSGNVCKQWAITTKDTTTGASTTLNAKPNQAFNWVFGGVMEVYNISSCTQYPTNGGITFSNVQVATTSQQLFSPTFYPTTASDTPACGYGVNTNPTTTTLKWTP